MLSQSAKDARIYTRGTAGPTHTLRSLWWVLLLLLCQLKADG